MPAKTVGGFGHVGDETRVVDVAVLTAAHGAVCRGRTSGGQCGVEAKSETSKEIKKAQSHLDQNMLGQLRRSSLGIDSGLLGWHLFRCRTARSTPAPLFGSNLALENRD